MNERIREIRKHTGLTQQEFADKLGITRNTIATYETGKSNPSDAAVSLICREFSVNESWLRNNVGDPFMKIDEEDEYFKAATLISKDNDKDAMDAIIKYWKLDPVSKRALWNFIHQLAKK